MTAEKRKIVHSLVFPLILLIMMWLVWIFEITSGIELNFLGIYPLKLKGLIGIITSPLVHGDLSHLSANSLPVLILGTAIFYFYKEIAFKIFILIYLLTGIWVWFGARDAYHIGASGLIYGMGAFLFVSGIIRKETRLMAVSMIVIFVYGSMIWGVFPDFFPERNISWESHLMGLLAGLVLAFYFRSSGPQRKLYSWELEEEEENDDTINETESDHHTGNPPEIKYHYKEKTDD
jgi:membrane associated rhomboid family serine protease